MRRPLYLLGLFSLMVFGFIVHAQELPPAQPALDFIAQNPEDVAVLCYTPGEDQTAFALNPDEPFPLASTYKLIILAELARQVDAGLITPDETIPLSDVNAYWLPGTDGGAHQAWLDTLTPDQEMVTLADVASAMIVHSSNAAPDYLLFRLGQDGFPGLFDQLGLENTDPPAVSYLGLFLVFDNHEAGPVDIQTLDRDTLNMEGQRLANLYLTDTAWYEAEQAYQEEKAASLGSNPDSASAEAERQAAYLEAFDHQGSARDMLAVMEATYTDSIFSEEARQFMQSTLNWLMDQNPANREVYDDLGTKGGSVPSILTGTWYVTPKGDESMALAVFYQNIPLDLWSNWAQSYEHQGLELRVVTGGDGCAIFDDLNVRLEQVEQ